MKKILFIALFLILGLSACAVNNPTPGQEGNPTATIGQPTRDLPAATSTASEIPPTETPSPPTDTPAPTPTATLVPYGPDNFPDDVNPLTGLPVDDPSLLERRPLAVKIQLFPRDQRPPWGVSLADIVFDFYQNDGLTRLHAIFYSTDAEQVGPIRSARLFDESLLRMYKSIFAFGGADWRVYNRISDADIFDQFVIEGARNCPPMCRIDPNGYNYLVTNTAELSRSANEKGLENGRQNLNGMSFDPNIPSGGTPGEQIQARYSISAYIKWDYDPTSGRYLRSQDTLEAYSAEEEAYALFTDRLNQQQISAANVVVIPLIHEDIYPEKNAEVVDIKLSGSGLAYFFRDGQVYKVNWNRPASDSVLFFTTLDGSPFPLKPGNTWFQIIGQSSLISEPEDGTTWRFDSRLP